MKYFLDKELQTAEKVSFHPCDNTASVVLTRDMFIKFLSIWGGKLNGLKLIEIAKPCMMDITNAPDITTREEMYKYLRVNHDKVKEFWVRVNRSSKPESGVIGYVDAVEVALCFGWIDSTLQTTHR